MQCVELSGVLNNQSYRVEVVYYQCIYACRCIYVSNISVSEQIQKAYTQLVLKERSLLMWI